MAGRLPSDPEETFDEDVLWRRLRQDRDPRARARLVEHHLPYARILAAKLYARRQIPDIEFEEYHQYGLVGLLEAIDRYDPGREAQFRTYAGHRIEGAILNGIARYNERQEQIALKTRLRRERLTMMKGSAGEGGSAFERLADLAIGMALGYMLDDSGMYREAEGEASENPLAAVEMKELKRLLARMVEHLPEQERQVIQSHYFWGMGVEEIGAMLGVTKGRVSQIHRQALTRLLQDYRRRTRLDLKL